MKDANIDITSLGNVNGLIMEPVSPQNTITKRTYMDDQTRKSILGSVSTSPIFSQSDIDFMKVHFSSNNAALGVIDKYQQKLDQVNQKKIEENMKLQEKVEALEK